MVDKGQVETQIVDSVPIDGSLSDERCEQLIATIRDEPAFLEHKEFGEPSTKGEKAKFKKAVVAMANTSGGYILLGVADDGTLKGIGTDKLDNANLNNIASSSILPEIKDVRSKVYEVQGSRIGVIYVPPSNLLPHVPTKDAGEDIKKNVIYVRNSGQSEPANYDDLQRIIRKACLVKQHELMKHLEETVLQQDVRLIKEHLLGSKNQPERAESLLYASEEYFVRQIDHCLDEEILADLKRVMRVGRRLAVKTWRATKGATKQTVLESKDLHFIPILDRMTYIVMASISTGQEGQLLQPWLDAMASIYELANVRELGYNTVDQWEFDGSGRQIRAKEHTSYTVPEREVYKRLLLVSALAVRTRRFSLLEKIATLVVSVVNHGEEHIQHVIAQPLLNFHSGEGNRLTVFNDARELQVQNFTFAEMFDDDEERSLNDLVKADFLLSFLLHLRGESRAMNFSRMYIERVKDIITLMHRYPEKLGDGFTSFSSAQLRDFVEKAIEYARTNFGEYGSEWAALNVSELVDGPSTKTGD